MRVHFKTISRADKCLNQARRLLEENLKPGEQKFPTERVRNAISTGLGYVSYADLCRVTRQNLPEAQTGPEIKTLIEGLIRGLKLAFSVLDERGWEIPASEDSFALHLAREVAAYFETSTKEVTAEASKANDLFEEVVTTGTPLRLFFRGWLHAIHYVHTCRDVLGAAMSLPQGELMNHPFKDVFPRGFGYESFDEIHRIYKEVRDLTYQPPARQDLEFAVRKGFDLAFAAARKEKLELRGTSEQLAAEAVTRIIALGTAQVAVRVRPDPIAKLVDDLIQTGATPEFIRAFKAEAETLADLLKLDAATQVEIATRSSLNSVHRILARSEHTEVRTALVQNRHVESAVLGSLACDRVVWDYDILDAAAQNPRTPTAGLIGICRSNSSLNLVCLHPNATEELFAWLANHKESMWRNAAAGCERTPAPILTRLAKDEDCAAKVAGNSSTPVSVLRELAETKSGSDLAHVDFIRSALAGNKATPPDLLAKIATMPGIWTWSRLASNPNTPAATLDLLSKDRTLTISEALARHPNATVALLTKLAKHPHWKVRRAVLNHSNTPAEIEETLKSDAQILEGIRKAELKERKRLKEENAPLNLYRVTTRDHDEDWFFFATSKFKAARAHEDAEGYDFGDARATLVLADVKIEKICQGPPPCWAQVPDLEALGAHILSADSPRRIRIAGTTYTEGGLDAVIKAAGYPVA